MMKQVQLVQVDASALLPGMYIAELDRPWLGSPFLLEGFLLSSEEEMDTLRGLCRTVMVDVRRSEPASVRMLMETQVTPLEARHGALPLQRITRASASLVDARVAAGPGPAPLQEGPPDSFLGSLGTIVGEALKGGRADAEQRGPVISTADSVHRPDDSLGAAQRWRDAGSGAGPRPTEDAYPRPQTGYSASMAAHRPTVIKGRRMRTVRSLAARALDVGADSADLRGSVLIIPREKDQRGIATPALEEAHRLHDLSQSLMKQFLDDVSSGRELKLDDAQLLMAEMSASIAENPDPLMWLAHLRREDEYAHGHAFDCAVQMIKFAHHLGYARETAQELGLAGLLLDVGKIRLPAEIRNADHIYSAAQRQTMQRHVLYSIDILHSIRNIPRKVLEIVRQHHERIDGQGYPDGLRGKEVSILGNMANIIDSYTASISDRAHVKAKSPHEALLSLNLWRGSRYDEALVDQFVQSIGPFPIGGVVEMNTGEVGVVIEQNRVRRLKPTLLLMLDADKQPLAFPSLLRLMDEPITPDGSKPYMITHELPPGSHGLDPTQIYTS